MNLNQDEVFEAVRDAVADGEYADWLPAVHRDLADGDLSSFAAPVPNAPGGGYLRGTPEHFKARALGLIARLPPRPVAAPEAVAEVESAIGCALPPLLRRLFLHVANGGFGPRDGDILGVSGYNGGDHGSDWQDLLHVYSAVRSEQGLQTPRPMLWLYDWGCAIWSLVDCSRPEGQMWVWDPNIADDEPSPVNSLFCQPMTLTEWLATWLQGQLAAPRIRPDEITGELCVINDIEGGRWR